MTLRIAIRFVLCGERGIVLNRRISDNLRLQMFFAVLISLLAGMTVFGISFFLGNTLLEKTVYGHSFADKMADQQFFRLQAYVEDEEISTEKLQRLNAWCSRGEKVYLTIYQDDNLIYESHVSGGQNNEVRIQEYAPDMEDPDNEYILTLHGDVKVRAFLYYYAGDAFYFWMTVLSGMLAFLAFSLIFIILIGRKVVYIRRLKQELDILSSGQLEYCVTVTGKDELGELASGIDQMRRSIIKHQEIEKKMRLANSELITAMSHDLRTPLTSLLAYLEIIERKKYRDEGHMEELIHKSVGQAMRIKQMADKLFAYFLAYATEWETADMETIDADQLFHQILGDYAYALESKGLRVEMDLSQISAQISINIDLLQRALDNVYSNLLKYADVMKKIRFTYKRAGNSLVLYISNGVSQDREKRRGTGIGLITCRRIIEYHGGTLEAYENDHEFCITMKMPLVCNGEKRCLNEE